MATVLRQYVWDVPTRAFHWLLVALLGFSWWSAETDHMDWHQLSGLAVCGLLIFRILWGVFGTGTARFAQFVKGPRAIWSYLRSGERARRPALIGHNPLGGWSVVALLLVLATQTLSGLLAVDVDGIESGPLSYLVDFDQGRLAAAIHHISFTVLQGLVVLHMLAILFYLLVRRRNLVWAMIVGTQPIPDGEPRAVARVAVWRLAVAILVAAAAAWWIAGGARL
ncbi:cytochrome b/b6 domain-containing protein [Sphingomonas oligophenolica]|uniref:Cytochrome b/b6 domain-containing protein n=1 Tax=Sphingomonas oligophenolica TaxID=301154 RepID=A0ABU9Y3Y0_9SPHN